MMPWAMEMVRPMHDERTTPEQQRGALAVGAAVADGDAASSTAPMTSAPGSSHDIMLPNSELNRRVHPVGPHMDAPRGLRPPPPTLPDSLPVSRPKPL